MYSVCNNHVQLQCVARRTVTSLLRPPTFCGPLYKVHRIIRQAQKLTQCQCQSIQEIYNIVCTCKVRLIVGDEAHPLHQLYSKLRSGIRFKSMRDRTKRYLTSFVPASITHFNSLCRRWIKYVGWLDLQLCMCIMSYLEYFTYDIDSV